MTLSPLSREQKDAVAEAADSVLMAARTHAQTLGGSLGALAAEIGDNDLTTGACLAGILRARGLTDAESIALCLTLTAIMR